MLGLTRFDFGRGIVALTAIGVGFAAPAHADSFHLKNGQTIEATVLEATLNTLTLRVGGSVRPTSFGQIEKVVLTLADGSELSGELLGWEDGVYEIRPADTDQVLYIAEGKVLEEAAPDENAVAVATPEVETPDVPEAPAQPEQVAMQGPPTFTMTDGRVLVGRILHATGSIVTLRPEGGGALPVSRAQIVMVQFETEDGEVSGRLLDWSEGVYRIQLDDRELLASLDDDSALAKPSTPPVQVTQAETEIEQQPDAAILPEDAPDEDDPNVPTSARNDAAEVAEPSLPKPVAEQPLAEAGATAGAGGPANETAVAALDKNDPASEPKPQTAATPGLHLVDTKVEAVGEDGEEVVFEFRLDHPATRPLVVLYASTDATAKAGEDFEAKSGVVTFATGSTYAEVRVAVIDDDQSEGKEEFNLYLSGDPETIQFGQRQISAVINDDD